MIYILGKKENIFDLIFVAEVFIQLSSTEASNSAVKEVDLCRKPVIVCKNVESFDDYLADGRNGFSVNKQDPIEETFSI
jgi:hypothetical protein